MRKPWPIQQFTHRVQGAQRSTCRKSLKSYEKEKTAFKGKLKYSVAWLCHLLPKRRCNLMQGQKRVALQWHQQAIAHPQATRCLHTSFEKICEASRMVNPNIFAKPTGHQNPINTNIIFPNLCGKLLMIDFVKMAKTPTPHHQGAQIQGTTEDRASTPNSIIIVVQ